jgi:hypothetical protein
MSLTQKLKSLGSSPRSSEGIYKKANEKAESIAEAAASIFSSKEATTAKKSSIANKLSSMFSSEPTLKEKATATADKVAQEASEFFSTKPTVSEKSVTSNTTSFFSPNKSSASRLISVPKEALSSAVSSASIAITKPSGFSFWRYLIIFLIILFLGFNLFLFFIKPADKDISHLYDPITKIFAGGATKRDEEKKEPKKDTPAIKKLEKVIDKKPVVNKIDKDTPTKPEEVKKNKKLPVIPEADDSTSTVQSPASKSGFCYIGEDRGFRSCINVGEGDVCMSGDIFPTEAICINPNLRQ